MVISLPLAALRASRPTPPRGCQLVCGPSPRCRLIKKLKAVAVKADAPIIEAEEDVGWLWTTRGSSTRDRLSAYNAKPKRSLGQNFVTDENILTRIVASSGVEPGDLVLEIGPGTGNLTAPLLRVRHTRHSFVAATAGVVLYWSGMSTLTGVSAILHP
jgi:Ribosomal RNA adenine dimethylase